MLAFLIIVDMVSSFSHYAGDQRKDNIKTEKNIAYTNIIMGFWMKNQSRQEIFSLFHLI